ncbi:MAG: ComEA family DNA-binding protein [Firmicutes bacterium]|nr:ComEA family DNA-binding protein [Bacillota bacterium]
MKEAKAFWLMAIVFILVCVGMLLFSYLNLEREAVYYVSNDSSARIKYDSEASLSDTEISDTPTKDKININTALEEELISLPGIGEKTARSIIAYREENGAFKSIEEIMEVNGIGEGKFDGIKDYITV